MKLYEITKEYEEILNQVYDDEDNVNQTALIKLEEIKETVQKKAVAVACFIKNMEAEKSSIEEAKKNMMEREKRLKKRVDDMEGYLLHNMQRCGIERITCPYFEIKLKKCPPSVDVLDEKSLPEEYIRTKVERLPDKIKMKEEMMAGVLIPGAMLKSNLKLDIR